MCRIDKAHSDWQVWTKYNQMMILNLLMDLEVHLESF